MTLNDLAVLYRVQVRYEEADVIYGRALAIFEHALGASHFKVLTCLKNYAALLRAMNRPEEADALEARISRLPIALS
jgi:hypothetical protein